MKVEKVVNRDRIYSGGKLTTWTQRRCKCGKFLSTLQKKYCSKCAMKEHIVRDTLAVRKKCSESITYKENKKRIKQKSYYKHIERQIVKSQMRTYSLRSIGELSSFPISKTLQYILAFYV